MFLLEVTGGTAMIPRRVASNEIYLQTRVDDYSDYMSVSLRRDVNPL